MVGGGSVCDALSKIVTLCDSCFGFDVVLFELCDTLSNIDSAAGTRNCMRRCAPRVARRSHQDRYTLRLAFCVRSFTLRAKRRSRQDRWCVGSSCGVRRCGLGGVMSLCVTVAFGRMVCSRQDEVAVYDGLLLAVFDVLSWATSL
jgi:hypothetical protein